MDLNKNINSHYAKYMGMHLFAYGLKDSFIVFHSPAGCKKKSEYTISPHDIHFNEKHYFDNYINNVESIFGTEDSLISSIDGILENNNLSVIYIITTDVAEIIGFDVNQVINVLEEKYINTKFIYLQGQAIGGDLFDGYKEALFNTLDSYKIKKNNITNNNVSVNFFGYFFNRYEGDFKGDLLELENILNDFGIKINTFFPGMNNYSEIKNILNSKTSILFKSYVDSSIISLLEDKYLQNISTVNLPIGIYNTIEFIKTLGNIYNIEVNSYINEKLKDIIPKINLFEQVLLGKKFGIVGDSQKLLGILDLYLDVGMIPKFIIIIDNNSEINKEINDILERYNFSEKIDIYTNIERSEIIDIINNENYNIDILLGSSVEKSNLKINIKFLEIFFPMITRHFINNYTILGFNGVLNLLTDTYNLLNDLEYYNLSNSLGSLMGEFTFYHDKNEK